MSLPDDLRQKIIDQRNAANIERYYRKRALVEFAQDMGLHEGYVFNYVGKVQDGVRIVNGAPA